MIFKEWWIKLNLKHLLFYFVSLRYWIIIRQLKVEDSVHQKLAVASQIKRFGVCEHSIIAIGIHYDSHVLTSHTYLWIKTGKKSFCVKFLSNHFKSVTHQKKLNKLLFSVAVYFLSESTWCHLMAIQLKLWLVDWVSHVRW